jgi:hypothetical protein
LTSRRIDDAEPTVSEPKVAAQKEAALVPAAVGLGGDHPLEEIAIGRTSGPVVEGDSDTTHW